VTVQSTANFVNTVKLSTGRLGSPDDLFDAERIRKNPGDPTRREFTYFMLGGARLIYASAVRVALVKVSSYLRNNFWFDLAYLINFKFVATMSASADVLALASAEFDVSGITEGSTITVKWRGKPVFIRHRTEAEISKEASVNLGDLKDPQPDNARAVDPKW